MASTHVKENASLALFHLIQLCLLNPLNYCAWLLCGNIAMGQNTAWTWKDLSVDLFWSQKLGPLTHIAMKESLSHRQKQHIFLPQFLLESSSDYCLEIVETRTQKKHFLLYFFCLENTKIHNEMVLEMCFFICLCSSLYF